MKGPQGSKLAEWIYSPPRPLPTRERWIILARTPVGPIK